jgi:hypothetical protein
MIKQFQMLPGIYLFLALSACSSQGYDAEQQYDMINKTEPKTIDGDYIRCAAAEKVMQSYLADRNEKEYKEWSLTSRIICQHVRLREQIGMP